MIDWRNYCGFCGKVVENNYHSIRLDQYRYNEQQFHILCDECFERVSQAIKEIKLAHELL